jgi:hypothetical protein
MGRHRLAAEPLDRVERSLHMKGVPRHDGIG